MRRLTVLNVAFPFAAAGPDAVGGAEQILSYLDRALVGAGHRSIVVAAEGSQVAGTLFATHIPPGTITDEVRRVVHQEHLANIVRVLNGFDVDLIHMHGIDFFSYLPPAGVPLLVTLHLPPGWYPREIWNPSRPATYMHCVSQHQQQQCPAGAKLLEPIGNGVPLEAFRFHCRKRNYAIALGRICPEKNFHFAMDAAAAAGIPLVIGGDLFPYETHEQYFREQIQPRLNGFHRYLGPLPFARKRRLLAGARCLISASVAPETSSLVTMEAIACGTPVVALPSGALPELIDDGVTGILVNSQQEMADAIIRAKDLEPEACRREAGRRFSLEGMIKRYFEVYAELAAPRARVGRPALTAEVLRTSEALEALEPEWHQLWLDDLNATCFQSPAWLLPWWKHIAEGDLLTVAVRDERERLAGLLPLYVYTQSSGSRDLFPLGIATTDYLDLLARPGMGTEVAETAFAALNASHHLWDQLDLQQLRDSSPLLEATPPESWTSSVSTGEPCPVLEIKADDLAHVVPWNILQNLHYYRRRADRLGQVKVEQADENNLDEIYSALLRLHGARWSTRKESGVLADDRIRAAHAESLPKLLRADALRLYAMRLDGRIVAVLYALADPPDRSKRSMYYYISGFDPAFRAISPGTILIGHAIEQAIRGGFSHFDFLRGSERYKHLWGAIDTFPRRRLLKPAARPAAVPQPAAEEVAP